MVVRLALRFGVGVGVLGSVWLLFLQLSGNNPLGPKQFLGELLVPLAVVASQWFLRRSLLPAGPGVGRALGVGGLTVLLAAAMLAGSEWSLGRDKATLQTGIAEAIDIQKAAFAGLPKAQRNATREAAIMQQTKQKTAGDFAASTFTYVLLMGMLVALPSGVLLRK